MSDLSRFKKARNKGGAYLFEQLHQDGSFGDIEKGVVEYYKVPAALMVCGMSGAANQLLSWVRNNGFMENGDFGPRPPDAIKNYYYTYYNSWVVKSAHRLGQFDLSQRGMEFILDFWDSTSGGFYSSRDERGPQTEQDLWVVSGSGWCALYTGRMDVARGVGAWMKRLMNDQPNYPEEMWTVFSRARGLITEVLHDDEFRYQLSRDESRDQSFYHPGIAAGFLSRLYMATGEQEWLDLARDYMRFCDGVGDYHFRLLRAGKVGWAAAMLYTLTGEQNYRDIAIRVGDNLIDAQTELGYWESTNDDIVCPNNDATAELVVWLDEIHQAVGRDSY